MARDVGLFGPSTVTWRVHTDPALWIAGLRALYLQALHPKVMRAAWQHSEFFNGDAWSRFVRTVNFVAIRTYGTNEQVERWGARVRRIHRQLRAVDPDTGTEFRIDEPELLRWVHCAEIDSYLSVALRAGFPLTPEEADRYVDEQRRAASIVGLDPADVPGSAAELAAYYERMRPELYASEEAKRALMVSFNPKLPLWLTPLKLAVPPANVLAFMMLPRWARRMYGAPGLPTTDIAATAAIKALRRAALMVPPQLRDSPDVRRAKHLIREEQSPRNRHLRAVS
ncbi:MAG: DUF2236 domain-containing protein [Streptosporangiales bacterium]|nr:DUF2236 domain-containing protein [Streptosporangiales bacterium]